MIIYQITNIVNNKRYIGKTTKTITDRFNSHLATAKYGSKTYLHKALRKYGQEKFKISLIEKDIFSEDILAEREKFWIKKISPEYNMTKGGEGSTGRILSEESLIKMSIKSKNRKRNPHSEETRQKISSALKGRPLTNERKQNISKSKLGCVPWNKGKKLS
jgi:group I intron endonuclease